MTEKMSKAELLAAVARNAGLSAEELRAHLPLGGPRAWLRWGYINEEGELLRPLETEVIEDEEAHAAKWKPGGQNYSWEEIYGDG